MHAEENVSRVVDEEQVELDRAFAIHIASRIESNRFIHCNIDVRAFRASSKK